MTRLLRAELTKLRTTRVVCGLATGIAGFAALTAIAGVTSAGGPGNLPLSAGSLSYLVYLVHGPQSMLSGVALLLGILIMAGEFRHKTITQTVLATPDRGRVVAAKLLAAMVVGVTLAVVAVVAVLGVALPWLAAQHVPLGLDRDLGLAVVGLVVSAGLYGPLGVAIGALVRNQLAALVGAIAWMLVIEGLLLDLLHAPTLGRWLPGGAATALVSPGGEQLPMWGGGLLLATYAVVLAAIATRFVIRRDIT
jgi:ABC-2 type transport system permease protein